VIEFTLEGVKPVPQGSMRHIGNGRMIHNKAAELAIFRTAIALVAKRHFPTPLENSIAIEIEFGLQKPRTVKRAEPTVPPDLDKLVRAVLDALTGVAYVDDSQVTSLKASKFYAPGYLLRVKLADGGFEAL
jgi:crossover junction endodeoxyribonuclease RusA